MADIPEDIMALANETHLATLGKGYRETVEAIALAIMAAEERGRKAEREACVLAALDVSDALIDRAGDEEDERHRPSLLQAMGATNAARAIRARGE